MTASGNSAEILQVATVQKYCSNSAETTSTYISVVKLETQFQCT